MKSKKTIIELNVSTIVISSLVITLFVLGFVLVTSIIFDKDEFVMTKEECVDKDMSNEIYIAELKILQKREEIREIKVDYLWDGCIIGKNEKEYTLDYERSKDTKIINCVRYLLEIQDYEQYVSITENYIEDLEENPNQYCEQVEVDEIEIDCFNEVGERIDCDSIPKGTYQNLKYYPDREINNEFIEKQLLKDVETERGFETRTFYMVVPILTTEWLNDNCKCEDLRYSLKMTNSKCYKYKCGEHLIEII